MAIEGRPAGAARSDRRWRTAGVVVVAVLAVLALVAVAVLGSAGRSLDPPPGEDGAARAVEPVAAPGTAPATVAAEAPTTTTSTTAPACDRRAELDAGGEAVPAALADRLAAALARPEWEGVERSISVWVGGYGEVVAEGADEALLPASNEKLLTAVGTHLLLDPDERFTTEVRRTADGLVLRAGGDPTLQRTGPHSLAALARQVAAAGVAPPVGVAVDATAFEGATTAEGWQDWQVPTYVGPLSALTVDDNRSRTDATYLDDPAVGNAEAFAAELARAGVAPAGPVGHGSATDTDPVVASLDSAPVAELVRSMLQRSDNEIAEALVRRMGGGATATGLARITAALEPWCLHLAGQAGDGSGLSRADRRSAREWRRLLQVVAEQPWGASLRADLPVAGVSGTLSRRLTGPATAGNVTAKTGTIIGGSALSGYATTADGRAVVFSVVANGPPAAAQGAVAAIDALVRAVVAPLPAP